MEKNQRKKTDKKFSTKPTKKTQKKVKIGFKKKKTGMNMDFIFYF